MNSGSTLSNVKWETNIFVPALFVILSLLFHMYSITPNTYLPLHLPLDPSHATTRKQAHTTACCPRSQARLRLPHHCSHMLPWGQRLDDRFCPQQLQTAALMETLVPDRTQGVSIVYSRTHTQIVSLVLNVYTSIGWTIQSLWPNHKLKVSILTCSVHRVDKTNI